MDMIGLGLVGLALLVGLLLGLRGLVLWYFGLARVIALLEKIAGEEKKG